VSADRVILRTDASVLHVTLNRPDKRNAIDGAMVDGLLAALETADLSSDVRVVALRGSGTDFCSGADLKELQDSAGRPAEANVADAERLGRVFLGLRELPKPVVAIVHGRAFAGGCGLATACDLVVARDDATFGYPEVQRGFVPAMVLAMLRRAVGEKAAFDLVVTGRRVSAPEAQALGLASRVIPGDQFETEVARLLSELAVLSPSAVALSKKLLYAMDDARFDASIALGAQVNALARSTPDFKETVERFLKR
jgi:methylglutaconyl-CoA hydratase